MIENYIAKEIKCSCGRTHQSRVQKIVISKGVIQNELPEYLTQNNYSSLTVACDKNGYRVAGKDVCASLEKANIRYKLHLFTDENLTPDERAVGNLIMGADPDSDLILAVGSGTVNDLCRYVSAVMNKPFCTVGTAPSMDGYISGSSALLFNSLKLTFETHTPDAVFFDPTILAAAPKNMIAAGVGDLLGKLNCLQDWKLGNIVTGEWRCSFISDIMQAALDKTMASRDDIAAGKSEAIANLLESLLLSGVCMDYAGNSRPASGCEHHMSHVWEMRFLFEGRAPVFHGTKVGIGTVIALKAYEYVARLCPDFSKIGKLTRKSFAQWETAIRKLYCAAADDVLELERKSGKNSLENVQTRLCSIQKNWNQIQALAKNTIPSDVVKSFLMQLNAPTVPQDIGIEKELLRETILYAKEIRNRYTVLQLLWDLGELENFADYILEEYYR